MIYLKKIIVKGSEGTRAGIGIISLLTGHLSILSQQTGFEKENTAFIPTPVRFEEDQNEIGAG